MKTFVASDVSYKERAEKLSKQNILKNAMNSECKSLDD